MIVLLFVSSGRENLGRLPLKVLFPPADVGGMNPVCTDQLVHRFVPFEGFQRHTGSEFCAVRFLLCRHRMTPSSFPIRHSILSSLPVQFSGYIILFVIRYGLGLSV